MARPLTNAPRLETERLVLRGPLREDLPALDRFMTSSPQLAALDDQGEQYQAWYAMMIGVGHWQWFDYGFFTLQRHGDPAPLGRVGLLNHENWPQVELAWHLFEDAIGQGYAAEAATAVRDWAARTHGLTQLVSYIDTNNAPSQAVARRLDARTDGTRPAHEPESEIWIHPKVAA